MVYEAVWGLAPVRLSHLMLYHSPPPCNNLSALAPFHLVMIYAYGLFCFSNTGYHVRMSRLCTVEPQKGHSVGCRVDDAPWKCAVWQPSLYLLSSFPLRVLGTCWSFRLVHPSARLAPSCHPLNKYSTEHYSYQAELAT